ncbi:MAG: hypothetical protein M3323_03860 [Actinomycetota bacterium]|nr:hypothetical protein [Actinomycetota bacterium]
MVGFIVAGVVIGLLARLIQPGRRHLTFGTTVLVGLVGSLLGGIVANAIGTGNIFEPNVLGFFVAVGSAILLVGLSDRIARRDTDS